MMNFALSVPMVKTVQIENGTRIQGTASQTKESGHITISDIMYYSNISWNLEAARLAIKIIASHWDQSRTYRDTCQIYERALIFS